MVTITSPVFKQNARQALGDAGLQKALAFSKPQFMARRTRAVEALPEFEQLRDHRASDIKDHALANLDFYLETYADNVAAGGRPGALVRHRGRRAGGGAGDLPRRPARGR